MRSPFIPGVFATIVSHQRPGNVAKMSAQVGPATWYVPKGQGAAYEAAGAPRVVEVDGMLVEQRNAALREAWGHGLPCLQMDDDLRWVKRVDASAGDKPTATRITMREAVGSMMERLQTTDSMLAGGPPTTNLFFYPGRRTSLDKFIIASIMLVKPCDLFFDPTLRLKEDYDYTLQHLTRFGQAARCDDLLFAFAHYSGKGGCTTYRTPAAEAAAAARLIEKWPGAVRMNPKRDNEVLLRWKPAS